MDATINFVMRKIKNSQGLSPIIFRITKNRKSKIFTLKYKVSESEWDTNRQRFTKKASNYILKNNKLNKLENAALKIMQDFEEQGIEFTLRQFERKLINKTENHESVDAYLENYIQNLESLEKYGSSEPFRNLYSALKKYQSSSIEFKDLNYQWLNEFENFLRKSGNSEGGVAFKMRHLRVLFNRAINDDIVDIKYYPFRKYKISKLKGDNRKIALSEDEIRVFERLDLSNNGHLIKSHNYFLFSFYCRGINWADMMRLRNEDIFDGKIHYRRRKTKQSFVIEILPPVENILKYFENFNQESNYVFPILLQEKISSKQFRNRKHKTLKAFNQDLKEIGRLAGISKPITSYVARHSYATILKFKNVSVEAISELMGHSDVRVTKSYLKDFNDDTLDELSRNILKENISSYQNVA